MTLFDYVVLAIVAASVMLSVLRGFVREVIALGAWVAAFLAASLLGATVASWLATSIADASIRALVAFGAVFMITLLSVSLLAMAVSGLMKKAGLGLEDRLLGGFFGFARGMLIVMVLVLLAGLTKLPRQPAWTDAMLSPPLEALAGAAKPWLPQILAGNVSYD
ncbi:MAG TPA: CvpA family protein [Burkholderiales bacterium]|nr:CvpA family protein [Burkholderiales bacterium]